MTAIAYIIRHCGRPCRYRAHRSEGLESCWSLALRPIVWRKTEESNPTRVSRTEFSRLVGGPSHLHHLPVFGGRQSTRTTTATQSIRLATGPGPCPVYLPWFIKVIHLYRFRYYWITLVVISPLLLVHPVGFEPTSVSLKGLSLRN